MSAAKPAFTHQNVAYGVIRRSSSKDTISILASNPNSTIRPLDRGAATQAPTIGNRLEQARHGKR